MKIRQGDTVVVITGKDRGKKGSVLRVLPEKNRVVVGGINMRVKHVKKTPNAAGQRISFEASIHASNVMLADPKDGKPTRVGFTLDAKGNKARVAKKSGTVLERGKVKADAAKKAPQAASADKAETKAKTQKKKKEEASAAPTKAPFWKRVGFGSDVSEDGSASDKAAGEGGSASGTQHVRSASRGS